MIKFGISIRLSPGLDDKDDSSHNISHSMELAHCAEMACNSQHPPNQIYFIHNITFTAGFTEYTKILSAPFNLCCTLIGHTGGKTISGQNHPVDVLKRSTESIK